jgi:NADH dehydrogenase
MTGNRVNPVIADLPDVPKDKAGRLRVLPTLQVPGHPNVFAGGDCTLLDSPQPATAQVAYQQGAAIARNLNAVVRHQPPQLVQVSLRGTLIKLGQAEGTANLCDRFTITGRIGHLIRQGTYSSP